MIFLDLETTGFDPKKDKIIEFAAIRVNDEYKELGALDFLVNPQTEIPRIVQYITNIFPEDVANEKTFEERIEEVKTFIGDDVIVGHNIQFDISFLNQYGIALENKSVDSCDLATLVLPTQKTYALEVLSDLFKIEHQYKHRALGDVLACIDLLKILDAYIQHLPQAFWDSLIFYKNRHNYELFRFLLDRKIKEIPSIISFQEAESHLPKNLLQESSFSILEKSLSSVFQLEEIEQAIFSTLQKNGLVTLSKDFLQYFKPIMQEKFPHLQIAYSVGLYISESKLSDFLQKEMFSNEECLLLLKILRNQAQKRELNEMELNVHWFEYAAWRPLRKTLEEGKISISSLFPALVEHKAVFEKSLELSHHQEVLCIELREEDLDQYFQELVYEKRILKAIEDKELREELEKSFRFLKDYFVGNEDLQPYGKQLRLDNIHFESNAVYLFIQTVSHLLEKHPNELAKATEDIVLLLKMMKYDDQYIQCLTVSSKDEMSLAQYPSNYKNLSQKLPENTSYMFISSGNSAILKYRKDFFALENIQELSSSHQFSTEIYYPHAQFPGPKHPDFSREIQKELESIIQKSEGRILVLCSAKRQIEELFQYFSIHSEFYGKRKILANGFTGGKYKTLHLIKENPNAVFFCQADFIEHIAFDGLDFETFVCVKLPFEAPSSVLEKRKELFQDAFKEYVLPKALIRLERSVLLMKSKKFYIFDNSIKNKWAECFQEFLKGIEE